MSVSNHEIIGQVAIQFGIQTSELFQKKTQGERALPRRIAFYLLREVNNVTLAGVAKLFDVDHSTIVHGINKLRQHMEEDQKIKALVSTLVENLDYRALLRSRSSIDVLDLAQKVMRHPRREAMALSVDQITALASGTLDLWEMIEGYQHLAADLKAIDPNEDPTVRDERINELSEILTIMEAGLAGEGASS